MKIKIVIILKKLFSISSRINKNLFIVLVNLLYFFVNRKVKIKFDKNYKNFYAFDLNMNLKFYFLIPSRSIGFIRGLKKRFEGFAQNYLINDFNFEDGDLIIDVGANIGDLKGYLDSKNIKVIYYGFEPSIKEFEILKLNCGQSYLENKGCWNENGVRTFYISSENADSSFEKPASKIESKIDIEVLRIDSLINQEIKLLKIDGEGCELEILEGCNEVLEKIKFITVDAGYERGVNELCTFPEVANFLYSKGFTIDKFRSKDSRVCGLFKNNK